LFQDKSLEEIEMQDKIRFPIRMSCVEPFQRQKSLPQKPTTGCLDRPHHTPCGVLVSCLSRPNGSSVASWTWRPAQTPLPVLCSPSAPQLQTSPHSVPGAPAWRGEVGCGTFHLVRHIELQVSHQLLVAGKVRRPCIKPGVP
jgi:hypothetical protein